MTPSFSAATVRRPRSSSRRGGTDAPVLADPLDDLTSLVVAEYSDVPNANLTPTAFPAAPITAEQAEKEISYRTVRDTPQLRIEFGLPDLREHWATKVRPFSSTLQPAHLA